MKIRNLTAGTTVGDLEQAKARIAELDTELADFKSALCQRGEIAETITPQKVREFMQALYDGMERREAERREQMSALAEIKEKIEQIEARRVSQTRALQQVNAELEAQLKAANERADDNRAWVERAIAEATDQLTRQREEYEAQLAEASARADTCAKSALEVLRLLNKTRESLNKPKRY